MVGSQVTALAVPLTALLVLDASPGQLGVLSALQYAPIVLVTLPAGVLVDRFSPRPIMLATDAGRAAVYGAVGLLALVGLLSLSGLAVLAFSGGVLTAVFDVAYISYLPTVVSAEALVDCNARLEASSAAAEIGGQGLAGLLVQLVGAGGALLVDAATYVCSGVAVLGILDGEPRESDRPCTSLAAVVGEIRAGLSVALRAPLLRPLMLQSAWLNLLLQVSFVTVPIYALRVLGLGSATLGLVLAVGSAGALAGCVSAGRLGQKHGAAVALIVGMGLTCFGEALLPLAPGPPPLAAVTLAIAYAIHGFGLGMFNVHSLTLRQREVPPEMLGRTVAGYRLVTWGGIPIGALIGGELVQALGPRPSLGLVAGGLTASAALFALTLWRHRALSPTERFAIEAIDR